MSLYTILVHEYTCFTLTKVILVYKDLFEKFY